MTNLRSSTFSLYLICIVLAASSCAPEVKFSLYQTDKTYPSVAPAEVEIYRTSKPDFEYEERGYASLSVGEAKLEYIYDMFRDACAEHGANAVIHFNLKVDADEEVFTFKNSNGMRQTARTQKLKFTATGILVSKL